MPTLKANALPQWRLATLEGRGRCIINEENIIVASMLNEDEATLVLLAPAMLRLIASMYVPEHPCYIPIQTMIGRFGVELVRA